MYKAKLAYLKTQMTTTSQGELVVLLYDGAIKFLRRAKEKMEEKDYAEKGVYISKALDVIQELDSSLNMEKGGDLSNNLHSLYIYSQGKLLQANLKMNQEFIDEVINILSSLREAFASIANTPEALEAQKLAPQQAPVNLNQVKSSALFGMNEVAVTASAPTTPTSASFRAKAYQQQAFAFGATSVAPAGPVESIEPKVTPVAIQNVEPTVPAAVPVTVSGEQVAAPVAQQVATAPIAQAQTPPAATQALTGFARQMINNSLYKKMAVPPQAQATTK